MLQRVGYLFALCAIMSIALIGCGPQNTGELSTRLQEDEQPSPIVAVIPVFDRSGANMGWSLSEEFTDHLRDRLHRQNTFCLTSSSAIRSMISQLNETHQPFSQDIDWIKTSFKDQEFVVFSELVEHNIHDKPQTGAFMDKFSHSCELSATIRIRIFDIRGSEPIIVLQELIHQTHLVPRLSTMPTLDRNCWKNLSFHVSPIGLAHTQLVKEVEGRITEYISLAQEQ